MEDCDFEFIDGAVLPSAAAEAKKEADDNAELASDDDTAEQDLEDAAEAKREEADDALFLETGGKQGGGGKHEATNKAENKAENKVENKAKGGKGVQQALLLQLKRLAAKVQKSKNSFLSSASASSASSGMPLVVSLLEQEQEFAAELELRAEAGTSKNHV